MHVIIVIFFCHHHSAVLRESFGIHFKVNVMILAIISVIQYFMFPKVDTSSLQAEEVWTGVTYAVAAAMIQEVVS